MRIVNWNIEWMNDWFVGYNEVAFRASRLSENSNKNITDVDDLCKRVAKVITDMKPDVLLVEEGPSDIREMQLFVTDYLNGDFSVLGGIDGGSQKIYALVKNGGKYEGAQIPTDAPTMDLEDSWEADVDGNLELQDYEFTRRPLVIEGTQKGTNENIRIVTLHTKSKYVHRGREKWQNPTRRHEFVEEAITNRRRISTEAMRTREYLDAVLSSNVQQKIVVAGDFNDGPGIDYFEKRYLTHNVTDIILGSVFHPENLFVHGFITNVAADQTRV